MRQQRQALGVLEAGYDYRSGIQTLSLAIPWDCKSVSTVLTNVSGEKIITYLVYAVLLGRSRGHKGNEDTFPGQAIEGWFQAS